MGRNEKKITYQQFVEEHISDDGYMWDDLLINELELKTKGGKEYKFKVKKDATLDFKVNDDSVPVSTIKESEYNILIRVDEDEDYILYLEGNDEEVEDLEVVAFKTSDIEEIDIEVEQCSGPSGTPVILKVSL